MSPRIAHNVRGEAVMRVVHRALLVLVVALAVAPAASAQRGAVPSPVPAGDEVQRMLLIDQKRSTPERHRSPADDQELDAVMKRLGRDAAPSRERSAFSPGALGGALCVVAIYAAISLIGRRHSVV